VQQVALPLVQDANAWPASGEQATISGWGSTTPSGASSALLRAATVQILSAPSEAKCGEYGASYVPGNHVCAGMPIAAVRSPLPTTARRCSRESSAVVAAALTRSFRVCTAESRLSSRGCGSTSHFRSLHRAHRPASKSRHCRAAECS
jgi:hypothetical protein